MTRKRNFVVLTHGRTGSSLLTLSLLEMGLASAGEVFHEEAETRADAMVRGLPPYDPQGDGAAFIRDMLSALPAPAGFKLFYEQARKGPAATVWDFLVETRDIAVIHLVRRDLLAAWVSYEIALRTGVWVNGQNGSPPADIAPFAIDAQALAGFFDRITAAQNWVRQTFDDRPFLEITYEEDLCINVEATLARITEFIGAASFETPKPVIDRIAKGEPTRHVANFQDLAQRFKHTPHEDFFWNRRQFLPRDAHPGFCSKPFETYTIDARGRIRVCCEDWLHKTIGDARSGSLRAQWNSPDAQAIRASILDGSYRYCNKLQCPDLVKKSLPKLDEVTSPRHREWIERNAYSIEDAPAVLSLGYDPSCNLKCPTCRHDFIVLKDAAFAKAEKMHEAVIDELMPHAARAIITGHGDAFSSRLYRRFLRDLDPRDYPELKVLLMTNGLSFTPQMWESMAKAHKAISGVSISVDAATRETYLINRGGNFDKLLRNLEFIGGLHGSDELQFFEISFVVQANNYAEMPKFVELAKDVGCDSVLFMKLIFWPGTFPKSEWPGRAVHLPDHPAHTDFLHHLRHPLIRDPMVDLSNLADLAAEALETSVADAG
jgi:LPS sulfotransferase NodH